MLCVLFLGESVCVCVCVFGECVWWAGRGTVDFVLFHKDAFCLGCSSVAKHMLCACEDKGSFPSTKKHRHRRDLALS